MSYKVLIIEDDADAVKVLARRLQAAGFDVSSAPDAMTGVKEALQRKPDLIVLDLMLPAGGGIKVLETIRVSTLTSTIPIVIVSGMEDEAYKAKVMKFGPDAFIKKPYDAQKVVEEIQGMLGPKDSGKPKILVVDDDEDIVKIIKARLTVQGYAVTTAKDGEDALDKARVMTPDLVVTDLLMPNMNGWQLAQRLRENPKLKKIPVIVLSAIVEKEGAATNLDEGNYYIAKPFDAEKLLAKIKELLPAK